jgi:hypothetical protein
LRLDKDETPSDVTDVSPEFGDEQGDRNLLVSLPFRNLLTFPWVVSSG